MIYGVVKCHRIFDFSNVIISNSRVYICLDEILVTICCSTALRYLGQVVKCPGRFLSVIVLNILMSSANRNVSDLVSSGRSFMYSYCSTKSNGPITEPWGIPEVTLCHFDSLPFTATFCFLSVRNASIQIIIAFLIL